MARYSKTLTPAAQAAFLAELRGGAMVAAAAASVGVGVSGLSCRRRLDPEFDREWRAAAEASYWSGTGRRRVRTGRRLRFAQRHRRAFLAALGRSCDTRDSARRAGMSHSTVYRHLAREPDFAAANAAALRLGYRRLARLAEAERARSARRLRAAVERMPPGRARPPADFERQMRLLDRWWRPRRAQGSGRPGRPAASFAESLADLETKLARMDLGPGFG